MRADRPFGFQTRQIHAGQNADPSTGSLAVPIHQTTSFQFRDTEHAANLFALKEMGNIYTRIMNPTTDVLEQRVAALDGGVGALAASSGHAAQFMTFMTLCEAGDHIIASSRIYGGTHNQLAHTIQRLGVEVTFVNPRDTVALEAAIRPRTKMIYGESLGNPDITIFPIEEVSAIAKKHGIPLVIDNTFATPWLFRPLEHGADIVLYSTTKFLTGHGTTLGGVIVDGGTFDWKSERFPNFNTPDPSYNGLVYSDLGAPAFILKARVLVLRDLGACQAPFNAWQTIQGLETLSLRMQRHIDNTRQVIDYLLAHPKVRWVNHPNVPTHPDHEKAKKLFPRGAGSVFGFGLEGGREAGSKFINALQLFYHLANVGDSKSLAIHPASTTHSQLSDAELEKAGVSPDFVRLSIGLEDIEDILWDIEQAIEASQN